MSGDSRPVTEDQEVQAELKAVFEAEDTIAVEARVRELGIIPPDERPGWTVAWEFGPEGEDLGMVWAEPDDEDDRDG